MIISFKHVWTTELELCLKIFKHNNWKDVEWDWICVANRVCVFLDRSCVLFTGSTNTFFSKYNF